MFFLEYLFLLLAHAWNYLRRSLRPGGVATPDMSQVTGNLWLGGFPCPVPPNITAVLNAAVEDLDRVSPDCYYLRTQWLDFPPAPSLSELQLYVGVIDSWLQQGRTVLVHCDEGRHRSAFLVIAYLMFAMQWSLDKALAYVKSRRPSVGPHFFQERQLKKYETYLAAARRG
jgi:protein-tyrosine phosphatase